MTNAALGPESWQIGNHVVLRTVLKEEVQGIVFAFDETTNVLLLKEQGSHNGVNNLRILNGQHVEETLRSTPPPAGTVVDEPLPTIDSERVKRREEKALKQAEQEFHRVNVGVSKEAQAIFEALNKTLPCHWKDKTIVVLEEVFVPEPYTAASVTSEGRTLTNPKALDRVRMIVRDARRRIGLPDE